MNLLPRPEKKGWSPVGQQWLQVLSDLIEEVLGQGRDRWDLAQLLVVIGLIALVIWMIIDP